MPQLKAVRQEESWAGQPFCSIQAFRCWHEGPSILGRTSFDNPPFQIVISAYSVLMNMSRIKFKQIIGHTITQSIYFSVNRKPP